MSDDMVPKKIVQAWRCLYCHRLLEANEHCTKDECVAEYNAAKRRMGYEKPTDK